MRLRNRGWQGVAMCGKCEILARFVIVVIL